MANAFEKRHPAKLQRGLSRLGHCVSGHRGFQVSAAAPSQQTIVEALLTALGEPGLRFRRLVEDLLDESGDIISRRLSQIWFIHPADTVFGSLQYLHLSIPFWLPSLKHHLSILPRPYPPAAVASAYSAASTLGNRNGQCSGKHNSSALVARLFVIRDTSFNSR